MMLHDREFQMHRVAIAIVSMFVVATPSLAMELAQVPAHVTEVARHFAPDAQWESAGTDYDTQLMEPEYEIKGKTKDGKAVEIDVSPDGKIHEVETAIAASEVPGSVLKMIETYLPGFEPTLVEMSARPDNVNFYEFEGKVNGRDVDIEVNAAGTEIIIADDSAI
jgi:hypothetical protein